MKNFNKQAEVHDLGKHIDHMVYKLYDLTPEEIAIVEGKRQNSKSKGIMIDCVNKEIGGVK